MASGARELDSCRLPVALVFRVAVLPIALPFALLSAAYLFVAATPAAAASANHGGGGGDGASTTLTFTSQQRAALKCAPVLLLAVFVFVRGRSLATKVLVGLGLVAAAAGDYFLVWPGSDSLFKGMICFGVAHILYFSSFGFRCFGLAGFMIGAGVAVCGVTAIRLLFRMEPDLVTPASAYACLLSVTLWRSIARAASDDGASLGFTGALASVASALLIASDVNLALDDFYWDSPARYGHLLTMLPYHLGQLAMALSTIDRRCLARRLLPAAGSAKGAAGTAAGAPLAAAGGRSRRHFKDE